ncbi:hypothetical protein QWY85_01530 [Neolewinella lacunae]|uniref:Uncharacterized protein n=1 Tax=Neolewinella lacunae TaxID=1517758 RepID=A0A923PPL9_9BACT|nr:hypothetical protein [Neolewinella lacunae]MBC6994387.1 hypothetical protein [Neolewinella lacunae]MDN3633318.1 hypothetical protein [Neolewinella lacunae]
MHKYSLSLLFICLLGAVELSAQIVPRVLPARVEDAIRFGNTFPLGTARFAATGGSMSAIGVDYTSLHTNPAGIGWNRNSSFQITPGFSLTGVESQLNGAGNAPLRESQARVMVPSAGIIWAGDTRSINFSTFNFGIGLTRLADFNETIVYRGRSGGSVVDAIVEDLNDGFSDPFRADLIFDIPNAIQEDELGFFSDFDLESSAGGQIDREGRVERRGGLDEFAIGAGGNYRESLLWGITLGIPFVNFTETKTYDERDIRDEITFFDNAGFDETLEMTGTGVNFKFGLVYLPAPEVRISAAVHSPTFWTIDEVYFTTLEYNYTDNGVAQGGTGLSPLSQSAINLQTPWRFMGGLGYIIGRSGFISVDADYSNFAGNSFSFDDFATADEPTNDDIDATLGGSLGIRVGGEVNVKPFQFRAGVGYRQLPMVDLRNDEDGAHLNYSGGVGFASGKFFVDAAVRYEAYNSFYAPYRTFAFDGNIVDTDRSRLTALLTVGFRGF